MRICCYDCWHSLGRLVTAVNLGNVWRCDSCAETVWLASQEISQ